MFLGLATNSDNVILNRLVDSFTNFLVQTSRLFGFSRITVQKSTKPSSLRITSSNQIFTPLNLPLSISISIMGVS